MGTVLGARDTNKKKKKIPNALRHFFLHLLNSQSF